MTLHQEDRAGSFAGRPALHPVGSKLNAGGGVVSEPVSVAAEELLERSAELGTLYEALAAVSTTGRGRLVLIAGEAGVGKTALVQAFCDELGGVRVLAGGCEALQTPRPLGPLLDIAAETRGDLAEVVEAGGSPSDVLAALFGELRRRAATVVVLEDLHWADE